MREERRRGGEGEEGRGEGGSRRREKVSTNSKSPNAHFKRIFEVSNTQIEYECVFMF